MGGVGLAGGSGRAPVSTLSSRRGLNSSLKTMARNSLEASMASVHALELPHGNGNQSFEKEVGRSLLDLIFNVKSHGDIPFLLKMPA